MRNMSFALTTDQVINGDKDVTRRLGWLILSPGDHIQPVKKCMGLKKGEKPFHLRDPIRVVNVRREPLRKMLDDHEYGIVECAREGFGNHPEYGLPAGFVAMFCATHRGCTPETIVTRIEFSYTPAADSPVVDRQKNDARGSELEKRDPHFRHRWRDLGAKLTCHLEEESRAQCNAYLMTG